MALPVPADAPLMITVGNAVIPLRGKLENWANLGLVGRREGESVSIWRLAGARHVHPLAGGPVGDCHAVDDRAPHEVGIRATVLEAAGDPTLRLSARAHSACVDFPLIHEPTADVYSVRFRYRHLAGNRARACLWQAGIDRCAPAPDLRPGRRWQTFEAAIRPDPRTTAVTLFLYADGPGRARATVTEYQQIRLERYQHAGDVPHAPARLQALPGSSFSERTLALARAVPSHPLDLANAGPAGDCHRYDSRTPAQLGLDARVVNASSSPVLQLRARDHSACVDFGILPFDAGARAYRIRLEYRRVSGLAPRVCLWQEGPDRCASLSELDSDADWRVLDETVRLDPDVKSLRLYLYADGGDDRPTVSEYRQVHVLPIGSVAIIGVPRKHRLPQIAARREAPWKLRVKITDSRGPFLLVTSEAYSQGWKAHVHGREGQFRHVQVNGYANGWLVPWRGSYELTLEYEPERYARGARWLSVIAPLGLLGWIVRRRTRWLFYEPRH
jgi:arabinofuranan 3-O-arabinosyltransferase